MAVIFTPAEARAFDKLQLGTVLDFPDVDIVAKEVEIREWLERACGVNFVSTVHSDEVHDGEDSNYLQLDWPLITVVTAISVDGVAFAGGSLNATDYGEGLAIDPVLPIITRRSGIFESGWSNVMVTYTAGHATTPALVKRAALMLVVNELPAQNAPWAADSFEAGGTSFSWQRGDGYRGNWSSIPDVQKAINMYTQRMPGVA